MNYKFFFCYNLKVQGFSSCFLNNKICFILNMIKTDFLRTKSSKMGLTRSDRGNHSSPPTWYSSFGKRELVKTAQAGLDGSWWWKPIMWDGIDTSAITDGRVGTARDRYVSRPWGVSVCSGSLLTKTIFFPLPRPPNVLQQCALRNLNHLHLFFSIDSSTLSSLVDYFWPCYDCNIYWAHNYYEFF